MTSTKTIEKNLIKIYNLEKEFTKLNFNGLNQFKDTNEFLLKLIGISSEVQRLQAIIIGDLSLYDKKLSIIFKDENAERTFYKIKKKGNFNSINFLKKLMLFYNENNKDNKIDLSINSFIEEEFSDAFEEEIRFRHDDFFKRRSEILPIISSKDFPDRFLDYFKEIRDNYGYGNWFSTISLTRALLEIILYDFLKEKSILNETRGKNIINFNDKRIEIADMTLNDLIRKTRQSGYLNSKNHKKARLIQTMGNHVLHKGENPLIDKNLSKEIVNNLLDIIQQLFK